MNPGTARLPVLRVKEADESRDEGGPMRTILNLRRCRLWACALAATLGGPEAGETPTNALPSAEALRQGLAVRAPADARIEKEMEAHYRFTHTRVREEFNLKGKSRRREVQQEIHDPTSAKPATSRPVHGPAKKMSADDPPDEAYERKETIVTEELLRRFEFTPLGRELVEGAQLLKADFRPTASAPPAKGLLERFLSRMAGTIWVDETDFTVVRARFYLTEKLNVGAGVLGSVSSFDCRFERARTGDGTWYTRALEWRLECREFLVNKIIEQRESWNDLRKVQRP
jgi:hypothetical protein